MSKSFPLPEIIVGKLHKIRKAYERLPEKIKEEMASVGGQYGWNITFDKKGRVTICRSVGEAWCRHNTLGISIVSKDWPKGIIDYKGEKAHKPKRPYYFSEYLKFLGIKSGRIKKRQRTYSQYKRMKITYNEYHKVVKTGA